MCEENKTRVINEKFNHSGTTHMIAITWQLLYVLTETVGTFCGDCLEYHPGLEVEQILSRHCRPYSHLCTTYKHRYRWGWASVFLPYESATGLYDLRSPFLEMVAVIYSPLCLSRALQKNTKDIRCTHCYVSHKNVIIWWGPARRLPALDWIIIHSA